MSTKINFAFPLLFLILSFGFACQKEAIEEDIITIPSSLDFTHFEGVFHGQRTLIQRTLPPYNVHNTADQLVNVYVENDSLKILDYVFPIDSLNQTTFDASSIADPNSYDNEIDLTLEYSDNYNKLKLVYRYSCYYGPTNGCKNTTLTFNGTAQTAFANQSILPHVDVLDLVGNYDLSVIIKNTTTNEDTQYTGVIPITSSGNSFMFGQKSFYFGLFQSYLDWSIYDEYYTYKIWSSTNLYWENSSLSLQYSWIKESNGVRDTIRYSYIGTKQ